MRISDCGKFEIWWDKAIPTSKRLDHNRPYVVVFDRSKKHWTIIDFSVPNDKNVIEKEKEKINNYKELAKEICKIHNFKTKIVPLVIGCLGRVTENLYLNLEYLEIPHAFLSMQASAVIGTAIVLRNALNL